MKLSEKIIKLRKEKGISQEELGNLINVSRQSISKWESEQSIPDIENIKQLAKFFEVSYEYLLNDDLEEKNKKEDNLKNKKKSNKKFLKILIIILSIYLIVVLYKIISLFRFYLIANSFSEENFVIMENIKFINFDGKTNENNLYTSKVNNVLKREAYFIDDGILLDNPDEITFIDFKNKEEYSLEYSREDNTYFYQKSNTDELENEEEYFKLEEDSLRQTTLGLIPSNLKEIILESFNPIYVVNAFDRSINYITRDGIKVKMNLNEDYLIEEQFAVSDNFKIKVIFNYDYVPDHFTNKEVIEPLEEYKELIVYDE